MPDALIIDAVRSPIGKKNGALASIRGDELAAQVGSGRLAIPLVRFGLLPGHESTGVRFGHYIVLYAVAGDGFMYQDPAVRPIEDGRARWISRVQLDQAMAPVWPPRQAVALGG